MKPPQPIRAVLLDGLGTLLALAPPWPAFAAGLQRDHGISLTPAEARWAFVCEMDYYRAHHHEGRDRVALARLRVRCAEVLRGALPTAVAQQLSPEELAAAMLGSLRFSAYADALTTLPLLRARGVKLVVVSNWDVSLAQVLADLQLTRLLDGVVTSAQVGRPKPAPDVFAAALALTGTAPRETLHVGDDPYADLLGAQAAGVNAVLLCRDMRAESRVAHLDAEQPAPAHTIASLAQLLELL
jgi:putative hydrolase of the HAD superfamily